MSLLAERLETRIRSSGPISFAEVMAEALYGEAGYYRKPESPIGPLGDYITGSSISPLFGRSTAQLLKRLDVALGGSADFLEVGYGNGQHLEGLLVGLPGCPERRILAFDRVPRALPEGVVRLESLESLRHQRVRGLIFSYELFDALPVHRLIGRSQGGVGELWVGLDPAGGLRYIEGALSDPGLVEALGEASQTLAPGQIADVAPGWTHVYRQMAELLEAGLLVTCDYGFERRQLLDPRVRPYGTLACYRQQRVRRDALSNLGNQDLTAHVDFTTLREAGEAAGLETLAFTRQARWLLACGLFDLIEDADQAGRLQAMELLHPEGMGEEIRVLVQGRGIEAPELLDEELLGG